MNIRGKFCKSTFPKKNAKNRWIKEKIKRYIGVNFNLNKFI